MLTTDWIRYGNDRHYLGYVAYPAKAQLPLPGVLVLQEIWGVDAHIQDVTRRFAQAGYVALAPDLLAVGGARPPAQSEERMAELQSFMNGLPPTAWGDAAERAAALAKRPAAERDRITETFQITLTPLLTGGLKLESYLPAVAGAAEFLRRDFAPTRGQRVAALGYCMGGGLAALLATADPDLAGAIIYYGSAPPEDAIPKIRCPVLGLYGGLDQRINAGIPAFAAAMQKHGKSLETHVYEGAAHAFSNDDRPSYHAVATRDAYLRTLSFLAKTLT